MIWAAIRSAMERNKISSFGHLAKLTGIGAPTLTQSRRRAPNTFRLFEIMALDRTLHFTDEEWRMIRE